MSRLTNGFRCWLFKDVVNIKAHSESSIDTRRVILYHHIFPIYHVSIVTNVLLTII